MCSRVAQYIFAKFILHISHRPKFFIMKKKKRLILDSSWRVASIFKDIASIHRDEFKRCGFKMQSLHLVGSSPNRRASKKIPRKLRKRAFHRGVKWTPVLAQAVLGIQLEPCQTPVLVLGGCWEGLLYSLDFVSSTSYKMLWNVLFTNVQSDGLSVIKGLVCLVWWVYPVIMGIYFGNKRIEMFSQILYVGERTKKSVKYKIKRSPLKRNLAEKKVGRPWLSLADSFLHPPWLSPAESSVWTRALALR